MDIFIIEPEKIEEFKQYVESSSYENIVFDVETDNAQERRARLFGIGLSFTDDEAFYIPIRDNNGGLLWTEEALKEYYAWQAGIFSRSGLIGHNVIYDTLVFEYNSGFDISSYIYSDTILLKHAVDEERPFGLKEVAVKYLGPWADKAQDQLYANIQANGGSTTKANMQMWKANTDVLGEYCGYDVILTRKLFNLFQARLIKEGMEKLFYEEETMPLYKEVTINMKRKGFCVNVPYFQDLQRRITTEISQLETSILADIKDDVLPYELQLLNEEYPIKRAGGFPKALAEVLHVPLPASKSGGISLAKKGLLELQEQSPHRFYSWMLDPTNEEISKAELLKAQYHSFYKNNPDAKSIFNLGSSYDLSWLFFTEYRIKPLSKTEGGKPQCDDELLDSIKDQYKWVHKLIDMRKLNKLKSTYIDGILELQIDGVLYASMLQFGTTSGRYSCMNPNLQNIPAQKEDDSGLSELVMQFTNAIKVGFIPPKGHKIVNADYSALEPTCFAHVSGDEKLREVFRSNLDLYSSIAINVFGIKGASANKKDPAFLKNTHPALRQKAKVMALAVVYGAEANRIAQAADVDYMAAQQMIDDYLDSYPGLKNYMDSCDESARKNGAVRTDFGRVRHLPQAKELYSKYGNLLMNKKYCYLNDLKDTRYAYKNALNNSKNFPIQGLAAHITNRAMIKAQREFNRQGIEAWVALQVHDELTCVSRTDQADQAASILKDAMENTIKISVPLKADPIIADNWAESK